jgi:hypothetical protein
MVRKTKEKVSWTAAFHCCNFALRLYFLSDDEPVEVLLNKPSCFECMLQKKTVLSMYGLLVSRTHWIESAGQVTLAFGR